MDSTIVSRIVFWIDRATGLLIDAFGFLCAAVIAFMAVAISAEVLIRAGGGRPFGWTLEVCEYGLVVVGFLGAPWVLRHSDHIRVDVVLRLVSPPVRHGLLILANTIAAASCFVLAIYGFLAMADAYRFGSLIFKYLVIPQWIILSILPVGVGLLALEFTARALRRIAGEDILEESGGGPTL